MKGRVAVLQAPVDLAEHLDRPMRLLADLVIQAVLTAVAVAVNLTIRETLRAVKVKMEL